MGLCLRLSNVVGLAGLSVFLAQAGVAPAVWPELISNGGAQCLTTATISDTGELWLVTPQDIIAQVGVTGASFYISLDVFNGGAVTLDFAEPFFVPAP